MSLVKIGRNKIVNLELLFSVKSWNNLLNLSYKEGIKKFGENRHFLLNDEKYLCHVSWSIQTSS